eukprot:178900-Rhodomonas_salina.3
MFHGVIERESIRFVPSAACTAIPPKLAFPRHGTARLAAKTCLSLARQIGIHERRIPLSDLIWS